MSTERSAIEGVAGRELDARVATELFGAEWSEEMDGWRGLRMWNANRSGYRVLTARRPDGTMEDLPPENRYSTSIAAAWLVVEKLAETHHFYIRSVWIEGGSLGGKLGARATFRLFRDYGGEHHATAHSAPLAICLAALSALASDSVPTPSEEGT